MYNGGTIKCGASYNLLTKHFHFTELVVSVHRIPIRVGRMSSVVVVDDVSAMVTARYVHMVRHRHNSVVFVMKAQYTIVFVCCVRQVNGESKEPHQVTIFFVSRWKKTPLNYKINIQKHNIDSINALYLKKKYQSFAQ